jgi:para-nitrobenzyl esterase
VYVFIHGGGNTNGSGDQHDGTKIVAESGVVVVTMNYRLGVFGWFAHPGLTDETGESGNYGFQDIEASLAWVHRNIAAFGGDPARVTVGGESAGAFSVCALLAAPGARGLFSAAMMQSGNCGSYTQQEAEGLGDEIAVAADCVDPATAVVCLRGRGVQALLDAAVDRTGDYVRGTPTLPLDPAAAVESGSVAKVPVVLGANLDEARTFLADWTGLSEEEYVGVLNNWFGADAPTYLALYPWPADSDQYTGTYLLSAIITDAGWLAFGGCATRTLADAFAKVTKVWVYEFAHRDGPGLRPEPVGYVWGAGHAAELPYLWPSFDNGTPIAATFDRGERRLAHDMVGYWGGFVQHHDPTGVRDLTRWPQYNARHQVLSLRAGGASTVLSDSAIVAEHHCDVWG